MFLATPNETSAELAADVLALGAKVIDISGAFRLKAESAYPAWYGFDHPSPALLAEAVYGLTEWCGPELASARLVANPGCYPTSVLLALKPLLGLLRGGAPVVADSKSGVSGAGKKSDVAYSVSELAGNYKAYGECINKYIADAKALSDAALAAGNKAVDEFNKLSAEIKAQNEAAKQ